MKKLTKLFTLISLFLASLVLVVSCDTNGNKNNVPNNQNNENINNQQGGKQKEQPQKDQPQKDQQGSEHKEQPKKQDSEQKDQPQKDQPQKDQQDNKPKEEKYNFNSELNYIKVNKSYTDNEPVNIQLSNVDINKFNIKYLIKYLNSNEFEELKTTSFNFEEKYNHALIKALVYKDTNLLFTSEEVLLYYKNKPTNNNILDENQQKQRKAANRELNKKIKNFQLLLAIGHNSSSVKSKVEFPFPKLEKVLEAEKNKDVVIFENNEIENYLNSIYSVDLSKISLSTWKPKFPRVFSQNGIDGLEYLINLEEIDLSNNNFQQEDVEEILERLPKIKIIKLNNNSRIKDFSKFAKYDIKELYLQRAQLTDEVLDNIVKSFPNLEVLNISYNNKLTNLNSLTNLKKLKTLYIDNLNLDNLDILKNLVQLEKLSMVKMGKNLNTTNESKLNDYTFLNSLTNLKSLDLSSNEITSLDFLNHTLNLNELRIAKSLLTEKAKKDFENIKKLTKLTKLIANETDFNIKDLSIFENLKHLTDLDLTKNLSIKKINFKKPNTSLRVVNLSSTSLDDDETNLSFKNIIELAIKNTPQEKKSGNVEYFNSSEVSYFDGNNYIIDHIDHWHVHNIGNENNGFYRTDIKNYKLLDKYFLIGFNEKGYFLNSKVKSGKFGQHVFNIFYFEGFPDFAFNMPEYKDESIKPEDSYLLNILNRKKQFILTNIKLSEEEKQDLETIVSSASSLYEKINSLNKFYKS